MCPPRPASIMRGTKLRMQLATPRMLTPITQFQSTGANSHSKPNGDTPALLHSRSGAPKALLTSSASRSTLAGSATSTAIGNVASASPSIDFAIRVGSPLIDVGDDDLHRRGRGRAGQRRADATTGTSDHCNSAFENLEHPFFLPIASQARPAASDTVDRRCRPREGRVAEHTDVPDEIVAALRAMCLELPEVQEEEAWVGTRWVIRKKNFAHVLTIDSGWPPAYARAAGTDGPATGADVPVVRSRARRLGQRRPSLLPARLVSRHRRHRARRWCRLGRGGGARPAQLLRHGAEEVGRAGRSADD